MAEACSSNPNSCSAPYLRLRISAFPTRFVCTMAPAKKAPALFAQLAKSLEKEGNELAGKVKGLILFKIDESEWTLDLRPDHTPSLVEGPPEDNPDLTLTISDDNFAKLVSGKLGQQQAFLLRKLKIKGSMGMAMKLSPILEAAAPPPQSKL